MAKETKDAKQAAKDAVKATKGKGKKHLLILMDETGSMSGLQESVVTGCNEFLHSFKDDKKVRATLAWFDAHPGEDRTRFKIKSEKISDVKPLTNDDYNPRGMTPLNDAIVDAITYMKNKAKDEDTVFIAIFTDGGENASETDSDDVRKLIKKYEDEKGWGFVFLGANINAEATATSLGLHKKGHSINFAATRGGTRSALRNASTLASARFDAGAGKAANESYLATSASALYDQTGGKLPEDEDEK